MLRFFVECFGVLPGLPNDLPWRFDGGLQAEDYWIAQRATSASPCRFLSSGVSLAECLHMDKLLLANGFFGAVCCYDDEDPACRPLLFVERRSPARPDRADRPIRVECSESAC